MFLGHNWGAEHDPETSDCSPSTSRSGKGKYLMYPYSVSGYDANNLVSILKVFYFMALYMH